MSTEDLIEGFKKLPSASVTDAMGRLGIMGWTDGIFPVSKTARHVAGRAVTVEYGPKRGAKQPSLMQIIRECKPGDVLVIAGHGTPCWMLGLNLATAVQVQGAEGLIIDGAVRDLDELIELPMPLFCRGGGTRPFSAHLELSAVNVAVEVGGAQIRPGDVVIGDSDGLVVVPADRAEDVLFQAGDIASYDLEALEAIKCRLPLSELGAIIGRKHALRKA